MGKPLNPNYHRDWQRDRAVEDPEWYAKRKKDRTEARREKKRKFIQELGGSCNRCGNVYPEYCYDFHHIDHSTKEYTPSRLFMLSDEKIRKELEKCVLLCVICHRIVHHEDDYAAHSKQDKEEVCR